ncbi:amidohydrolase [Bosea sp. (in: a-proteobacteria)]|uniref:amidohydrolase family protein n=1 Tax=Bosea sp. (in: a-proteobacteria) TaxID=1871050 RepID=UPI00262A160E|nr:amidohydrolase family protein [Bosea sp. (in: a-proteobacteria)]MCO5090933.1 amidohydrolase family protein [Bosea sp. (in: a-proteobacteria)]
MIGIYPDRVRTLRKPKTAFPAGACDCAIHIYGPPGSSRLAANRKYDPIDASLDDMVELHGWLGIERAVLVQASIYGTDHGVVLAALRRMPERLRAIAVVDESVSDDDLAELDAAGCVSARFNILSMLGNAWNEDAFVTQVARVARRGWSISLHASVPELKARWNLIERIEAPVIIDHMAYFDGTQGIDHDDLAFMRRVMAGKGRWLKVSRMDVVSRQGTPYDDTVDYVRALIDLAPDRTVWATDWPHVLYDRPTPDDADLVELFERLVPDATLRQRILVDAPTELFKFSATGPKS